MKILQAPTTLKMDLHVTGNYLHDQQRSCSSLVWSGERLFQKEITSTNHAIIKGRYFREAVFILDKYCNVQKHGTDPKTYMLQPGKPPPGLNYLILLWSNIKYLLFPQSCYTSFSFLFFKQRNLEKWHLNPLQVESLSDWFVCFLFNHVITHEKLKFIWSLI